MNPVKEYQLLEKAFEENLKMSLYVFNDSYVVCENSIDILITKELSEVKGFYKGIFHGRRKSI